jgi:hypothetical protein
MSGQKISAKPNKKQSSQTKSIVINATGASSASFCS